MLYVRDIDQSSERHIYSQLPYNRPCSNERRPMYFAHSMLRAHTIFTIDSMLNNRWSIRIFHIKIVEFRRNILFEISAVQMHTLLQDLFKYRVYAK